MAWKKISTNKERTGKPFVSKRVSLFDIAPASEYRHPELGQHEVENKDPAKTLCQ